MKYCIIIFLLFSFCDSVAQDTATCYFDEQLSLTREKNSVYPGRIIKHPQVWEAFAYHTNGKMLMHGFFADKKLQIKQGWYRLFYANGNQRALTYFNHNMPDSIFRSWHLNGHLSDSGFIQQQQRTGLWKTWYANGNPESTGTYTDGAPDGEWRWYHVNGQPATIEVYKTNKLQDISCFNTTGRFTGSNCRIERKPCPQNAYDFETFVIENLLYPDEALKKGIEGEVAFEFLITAKGKLTHINFTNKASTVLQNEVVRLLKSVTAWDPAVSHNRNVDYLYSYSVPFYQLN